MADDPAATVTRKQEKRERRERRRQRRRERAEQEREEWARQEQAREDREREARERARDEQIGNLLASEVVEGEMLMDIAEYISEGTQQLITALDGLRESLLCTPRPTKMRREQQLTLSPFIQRTEREPRRTTAIVSPFFATAAHSKKPKAAKTPIISPYFYRDPFTQLPTPKGLSFTLQPSGFGLIQERIRADLFALVVQTILWNQTTARAGRPVLFRFLTRFPDAMTLERATHNEIFEIISCLGLGDMRSTRLSQLAAVWVSAPPCPERRYGRRNYPHHVPNKSVKSKEFLPPDDPREGWEIAHLTGIGPYALDSYRIFYRDTLRGLQDDHFSNTTPEWQRVIPTDKDLRAYLVWRWKQDGWKWDPLSGERTKIVGEE
ncbi:DNA glycosylase [Polyplosphaeria fusca]|uniref:DNA glycosylase n=1 Tax=Polyplosphaeria fusca TaxID=682080 RepID=A0A9P4QTP5_9PLEO|nr:DNA glycosylase [Polyplosphaeria fusca]